MNSTPMSNLSIAAEKVLRREIQDLKDQVEREKTYANGIDTILQGERKHRDRLLSALQVAQDALEEIVVQDYLSTADFGPVNVADEALEKISKLLHAD